MNTYSSISAAAAANRCGAKRISQCCRDERLNKGDIGFRFADGTDGADTVTASSPPSAAAAAAAAHHSSQNEVEQTSAITGKVVGTYASVSLAARAVNRSVSAVLRCCRDTSEHIDGFGFRFANSAVAGKSAAKSDSSAFDNDGEDDIGKHMNCFLCTTL